MGKFSLEQNIKDRLQGHEVHIDKNELWKGLGIEDEEKDRKIIWFWWIGGFVGIVLIAGLWWWMQHDSIENPKVESFSSVVIDESIAKTGNETLQSESTSEKLASIVKEVQKELESSSNDSKSANNNNYNNNNNNTTSQQIKSAKTSTQQDGSLLPNAIKNESNSEIVNQNDQSLNSVNINSATSNVVSGGQGSLNQQIEISALLSFILPLTYDREKEELEAEVEPFIMPIPKTRKFELEVFGGVGSISRALSTDNLESDRYLVYRDTAERSLEHVSLGISLRYILGGGFYGKAGISVNRWNEQFSYSFTSDTTETIISFPEKILIDLQGNETTTFGEFTEKSYINTTWIRNNRLTQIDFPITLGYEYNVARWSVFGEASAIFNLNQKFTGYQANSSGEIIENPEIYKSSVGFNLGFNAGVGYGLTPRLRARLSARYYRSLGSVLLPRQEIDQRFSSLGLRFSLGYQF